MIRGRLASLGATCAFRSHRTASCDCPPTLALYASGTLDVEGHGEFDVAVPAFSALAGFDVYWQALIGAPVAGFSNLEATTIRIF